MTKTYSEQRAAIFFKAARDLRKVACEVLDDVQTDAEFANLDTLKWAKGTAAKISQEANDLELQGHDLVQATPRQEADLSRSRALYRRAVDGFQHRVLASAGEPRLAQINAYRPLG
ncbi:MAG TPA: hypothetical protein VH541_05720 [Gaiellaceae bacterium]|jgi:hypothetical protein